MRYNVRIRLQRPGTRHGATASLPSLDVVGEYHALLSTPSAIQQGGGLILETASAQVRLDREVKPGDRVTILQALMMDGLPWRGQEFKVTRAEAIPDNLGGFKGDLEAVR